ncbi:MAG: copper chaperone PCu(A)C [Magnetococcales bacterium]|nr:copper chaperone PCu(A)C [Magnetococcales bacterium]NGZ05397.1 copper chaperone PCu(A)C [Magnetococcales bacterium]
MKKWSALFLVGATLLATPATAENSIHVTDAWIRAAPPVAQMQAGYLTIQNHGKSEQSLIGATCASFAKVEIHETVQHDGQSHMLPKASIPLPPGAKVSFTPTGLHLMLINPQTTLKPMDKVAITLKFADGTELPVTAEVRAATGEKSKGEAGGHSHH